MTWENANTDLPLLGIGRPLYRFCNEFLIGSKYDGRFSEHRMKNKRQVLLEIIWAYRVQSQEPVPRCAGPRDAKIRSLQKNDARELNE
jgi:hypothetical protein